MTKSSVHEFIDTLHVSEEIKTELKKLHHIITLVSINMNRCIPFFMVFMLIQNFCISQSTNIQWGALSRGSGALQAIMPVEDADFLAYGILEIRF